MKSDLQQKKELAQEIALQCLNLNSIGDLMQDGKGASVDFELHSHIGAITVRVIESGWDRDDDNYPDFNRTLYSFSDINEYKDCMHYLKSLEVKQC